MAVPEQVSSSFRVEFACITCGVIQDMSVVDICFCREDIFARPPGEKLYLIQKVEIPNLPPKTGLKLAMGGFRSRVSLSHGYGHFVCTVHRELSFWSICPYYTVPWLVFT